MSSSFKRLFWLWLTFREVWTHKQIFTPSASAVMGMNVIYKTHILEVHFLNQFPILFTIFAYPGTTLTFVCCQMSLILVLTSVRDRKYFTTFALKKITQIFVFWGGEFLSFFNFIVSSEPTKRTNFRVKSGHSDLALSFRIDIAKTFLQPGQKVVIQKWKVSFISSSTCEINFMTQTVII